MCYLYESHNFVELTNQFTCLLIDFIFHFIFLKWLGCFQLKLILVGYESSMWFNVNLELLLIPIQVNACISGVHTIYRMVLNFRKFSFSFYFNFKPFRQLFNTLCECFTTSKHYSVR